MSRSRYEGVEKTACAGKWLVQVVAIHDDLFS